MSSKIFFTKESHSSIIWDFKSLQVKEERKKEAEKNYEVWKQRVDDAIREKRRKEKKEADRLRKEKEEEKRRKSEEATKVSFGLI